MQKTAIPALLITWLVVTPWARSDDYFFSSSAAYNMGAYPGGCLWETYCDESETVCQRHARKLARHSACRGCENGCSSAVSHGGCSSCTRAHGFTTGHGAASHAIPATHLPHRAADRAKEPTPTPASPPVPKIELPENHAPGKLVPQNRLPSGSLPQSRLPTTHHRPRRLTVQQVSSHATMPIRAADFTRSVAPVPTVPPDQSALPMRAVPRRSLSQWKQLSRQEQ